MERKWGNAERGLLGQPGVFQVITAAARLFANSHKPSSTAGFPRFFPMTRPALLNDGRAVNRPNHQPTSTLEGCDLSHRGV